MRLTTALFLAITTLPLCKPLPVEAALEDSPKALVDQAWQIVYRDFVDRTFNQRDWLAVRQDYLNRSYSSKEQAYGAVQEMLKQLEDPYTSFLPPQNIKDLVNNVSGGFIGVGLSVGIDPRTREWVVVTPLTGSPAEMAGIQPRDVVVSINGKATAGIQASQTSQYIIGPVGSKVFLQVRRGPTISTYQLVREQIDLNPLTYQVQKTDEAKIGYIRLPVFSTQSIKAMRRAIQSLEQQQVQGYILDMRGNPGGVFDAGIEIARMWMGQKKLISVVKLKNREEKYIANSKALTNKPLQVLVDSASASASEVVAGALQEHGRAQLVGMTTFGKGVVQSLENLADGSGVVMTIAKYYTPQGRDIHRIGITPDVIVAVPPTRRGRETPQLPPATDQQYGRALKNLLSAIGN